MSKSNKHQLFKRGRIVSWKAGSFIYVGKVVDSTIRDNVYPQLITGEQVKLIPLLHNNIEYISTIDSRVTQTVKVYDLRLPTKEEKRLYLKHRN